MKLLTVTLAILASAALALYALFSPFAAGLCSALGAGC